jgi:hypothetical protein
MRSILPNGQTGALAIAMAGAALAAVTMMFVPVTLLEGVAGSSGLSELICCCAPKVSLPAQPRTTWVCGMQQRSREAT